MTPTIQVVPSAISLQTSWRLPTGGSGGEYQALYTKYNSSLLMQGIPNFAFSGLRYSSSTSYQDSSGLYWPSTASNTSYAYNLNFNSSNVYPADYNYKYHGFTVRSIYPYQLAPPNRRKWRRISSVIYKIQIERTYARHTKLYPLRLPLRQLYQCPGIK